MPGDIGEGKGQHGGVEDKVGAETEDKEAKESTGFKLRIEIGAMEEEA